MGTRVFVGGLTYRVRERDLEKFFRKYGRIKEVCMKNGFAFVEFDDYRDADDAVYELNGRELLGERVSVEIARGTPRGSDVWRGGGGGWGSGRGGGYSPPPPRRRNRTRDKDMDVRMNDRYGPPTRTEYRLVVENLSSRVSWQDLKDFMRQAGEVTYADAHKQRRNEGVVEFASYSDLKNALDKLDDTELNGRRIRLIDDSRRGGRRRTRSSSSRSRSRSRSHRRRSRTRSRSRSHSRRSRSRSRRSSRSKSKSRERSKSASRSKSRSHSKSRSRSKSKSRERSKSKSRSRSRSRSRSEPKERSKSRSKSKSKAKSLSKDRSRSRSASKEPSKSKSRSRSKSSEKDQDHSPEHKDD
ncbi:serine-arginine protein 55 isoform X2 [Anabrus simplex]|uniref:serine-arginine protein 55 isoform X2 n=1 Tax=Anabrus simplex TaxID=316456 RepID=UPI0034DCDBE6